jgi:putative two-component system response regulator
MLESHESKRVLLVDDDDDHRLMLGDLLETLGYRVTEAPSGRAGLEQLSGAPPNLVLLDYQLPDMSGADFLMQREQLAPEAASVPVILLTALVPSMMTPTPVEILGKPFEVKELLALLKRHVR